MRIRTLASAAAAVAVAGTLSASAGLGATAAGADTFRSAAGCYTMYVGDPGQWFTYELVLNRDGTFWISGGGPHGTWSQPRPNGTLILRGWDGGDTYVFTGHKDWNGISTANSPGSFTEDGTLAALWYAVLGPPPPASASW
jgi:hypothetical protein